MITNLSKLPLNKTAVIYKLNCQESIYRRLLDLGFVKNTVIKPIFISPLGSPIAYEIRNSVIALRVEDASLIDVCYSTPGSNFK